MPIGSQGATQWLTVVYRNADGSFDQEVVIPVRFVPLTGLGED